MDESSGNVLYSDMSDEEDNLRIYVHNVVEAENVSEEEEEEEDCDTTDDFFNNHEDYPDDEMEVDDSSNERNDSAYIWAQDEEEENSISLTRSRSNSSATLLIARSELPIRASLAEKNAFPKINDAVAERVLNNPPVFYRSWAYHSLSYLFPGRTFKGTQNQILEVATGDAQDQDRWEVKVVVHSLDQSTGTIVGLMEALNVPVASSTVVTYWEGEVVDFVNHNLWTRKWGATDEVDIEHWKRFDAFRDLRDSLTDESSYSEVYERYIFMRWKEKFFVNILAQESGLTIAGFYYICIRRSDGFIEGFYYDPTSKPFQRLALYPLPEGNGHGFGVYTFA